VAKKRALKKNSHRGGLYVLLGLAALAGIAAYFVLGTRSVRTPYRAIYGVYVPGGPNGMYLYQMHTEGRRADGSFYSTHSLASDEGKFEPARDVVDLIEGSLLRIDPVTKLFLRRPLPADIFRKYTAAVSSNCLDAHPTTGTAACTPAKEKLFDQEVYDYRATERDASGHQSVTEMKVAPNLQWAPLESLRFVNGQLVERMKLEKLQIGPIDEKMFRTEGMQPAGDAANMMMQSELARGRRVADSELEKYRNK
jgi:hypothetical protein